MKQYKGFYIDHVFFYSKEEIDEAIKESAIKRYKTLCSLFASHGTIECSIACSNQAELLNRQYGLSWEELEEIEIDAYHQPA